MKVEMVVKISGTRDGVDWPSRGETIELPDAEAVDMLNAGLVRAVADETPVETATVQTAETATVPTTNPRKPRTRKA